jgi:phosphonate transport system substrate-binding protein
VAAIEPTTEEPAVESVAEEPPTEEPAEEPSAMPETQGPGTRENPIVWSFVSSSGDVGAMTASTQEIADLLYEETGLYVEANVATDYAGVVEMMCSDPPDAHMASLPPFAYLVAADRGCAEAALVAIRFGSPSYNGQIITRPNSGIDSIADLAGRSFCRPDPLSASGWIIPSLTMRANGINPETDLAAIVDSNGHDDVVRDVYTRSCDAGSTYVDARSTIEGFAPDVMDVVTVLEVSVDIPNEGVQFRPDIPSALRGQIVDGLLTVAATEEGGAALYAVYSWDGFEARGDSFYDPLRQELQVAGLSAEDFLE